MSKTKLLVLMTIGAALFAVLWIWTDGFSQERIINNHLDAKEQLQRAHVLKP